MTAARNYSSIAAAATLTSGASNVDTTIHVDTVAGFPSLPYTLCLDKDRVGEELVLVTAAAGTSLTVTRGYAGTTAVSHSSAATVRHVFTGKDAQDAADHVGDSTLHWNTTNTDTLALPWQWARPGFIVPGMTTGAPVTVSSAGPTQILAGPASGRRICKKVLITGAAGAVITVDLVVAGPTTHTLAKFTYPATPAKNTSSLVWTLPIANGETLKATVASGAATFTPVYGDRTDSSLDRLGLVSSSGSGTLVASGTARTIAEVWIANASTTTTATGTVSRAGTAIYDSVSLTAGSVFDDPDPFTITNAQALTYTGDSATALTYLVVGI